MPRSHGHQPEEGGALNEESSPRYHVAPRGLLFFYALLSIGRKPMSGYDLMREIDDKTEGAWRPGPGAVYPTLQRLVKQRYVRARKRSKGGPAQVTYEITPAGLRNIANAKRAMETSGGRMRMMSSLLIDLMEPDVLVRSALDSFGLHASFVRTLVESERSRLSKEDKLFVLRQYKLSLDRELARTTASISALEGEPERESTADAASRKAKA